MEKSSYEVNFVFVKPGTRRPPIASVRECLYACVGVCVRVYVCPRGY